MNLCNRAIMQATGINVFEPLQFRMCLRYQAAIRKELWSRGKMPRFLKVISAVVGRSSRQFSNNDYGNWKTTIRGSYATRAKTARHKKQRQDRREI